MCSLRTRLGVNFFAAKTPWGWPQHYSENNANSAVGKMVGKLEIANCVYRCSRLHVLTRVVCFFCRNNAAHRKRSQLRSKMSRKRRTHSVAVFITVNVTSTHVWVSRDENSWRDQSLTCPTSLGNLYPERNIVQQYIISSSLEWPDWFVPVYMHNLDLND